MIYHLWYQPGDVPVRLVENVAGRVFSLCHLDEATEFRSPEEARHRALRHGLAENRFTIKPVGTAAARLTDSH